MNIKKILISSAAGALMLGSLAVGAFADSVSVDFEDPPYDLGVINGQDGWSSLGAAGSGCALYDHEVDSSSATTGFGDQSLRISNAVTSGCFGDMTFAKPLTDAVGEVDSTADGFSAGTLQRHFEMQFDIASTKPGEQPGLFMSVSPDRGDGSRMSYLGFEDTAGGINIIFYDVQGTDNPANFVPTDLGTYSRTPHAIKLTLDTLDGPSNDVVKVWIDGSLVHQGTSWENYYRLDSEASAEQSPRIVKTAIFRTGGAAAPTTSGFGYLIDNLSLSSSEPVVIASVNGGGHLLTDTPKRKDALDVSFGGWVNKLIDNSLQGNFQINLHNVSDNTLDKSEFHGTDVTAINFFDGDSNTCDDAVNFTVNGTFNGDSGYSMIFRAGDLGSPNTADTIRVTIFSGMNGTGLVVYETNVDFGSESSCVGTARSFLDTGNITITR